MNKLKSEGWCETKNKVGGWGKLNENEGPNWIK